MKYRFVLCLAFAAAACATKEPKPVKKETAVEQNLSRLKETAQPGDLVVRLGDDLLSYQIKLLNETERDYSHAGVIVEDHGQKMVAHISPDEGAKDGLQLTAIDSFLSPEKNRACALYRYDLSPAEHRRFDSLVQAYKKSNLRFDRLYDLRTDDEMYCSEMISKTVAQASEGRIHFRAVNIPERLQPALYNHFNKELPRDTIATRKIMTIDNLYRVPQCKKLMAVTLKTSPGQ